MMLRRQKQQEGKEMIEQAQSKLETLGEDAQFWFTTVSILGILVIIGLIILFFLQRKVLKELRKLTKKQGL